MEERVITSNNPARFLFGASILFLALMCVLFIAESRIIFAEFGRLSFTSTGLLGMLAMFTFSLYAAQKGRPDQSALHQTLLALIITILGVVVYLGMYMLTLLLAGGGQ